MMDAKEGIIEKKIGPKTWSIPLLFCVLVSTCTCVLVTILLVNNYNEETPKNDAATLIQLGQIFPDLGILQNCHFLDFVLTYEMPLETQLISNPEIPSTDWKDSIKHFIGKHCDESSLVCDANARFRTLDGSCNNLRYPRRGMASRAQSRFLRPFYRNGIDLPRSHSVNGPEYPLPNPRMISNTVFKAGVMPQKSTLTVMHMAFGLFLGHDMARTPVHKEEDGRDLNCCLDVNKNKQECFMRISILENDALEQDCMNFVRSLPTISDSKQNYRDQINRVTSYIDASTVYGSNKKESHPLRRHSKGHLILDEHNRLPAGPNKCSKYEEEEFCQDAGDKRVNLVPNLSALHLLWAREHNRIADQLSIFDPNCKDDTIFFETRKIIIAIIQHITFNEYLPLILNSTYMNAYDLNLRSSGWSTGYDEQLDATMANGFGVAAFRFGHSQITNTLAQFSESNTRTKEVLIEKTLYRPHICEGNKGAGCEGLLRWMSQNRATMIDRFFETGIRNKLLPDEQGRTMDLPAININRGRDHGIPTYNSWREFCNLTRATHFQTSSGGLVNHSPEAAAALREAYNHTDDIDLFPGAMSESHIRGGSVGPTIACILGSQFRNSKNGDRFWYERNNGNMGLTLEQLGEIRKIRLSSIICNNIPVTQIQPNVFQAVSGSNAPVSCRDIPQLNLTFWRSLIQV